MKNKTISIIVPVYNADKYLAECIESLQKQTYKLLEIILVDDGSTDGSPKICDRFENDDNRICVIHKLNGGVSTARNVGLDKASGNYVMFVDSDDWLPDNACEKMFNAVSESDCAILSITRFNKVGIIASDVNEIEYESPIEYIFQIIRRDMHLSCFRCIFSLECIEQNGLRFTNGRMTGEDQEFVYKYLCCCKDVVFVPDAYYMYRVDNSSSAMHLKTYSHFDAIDAMLAVADYVKQKTGIQTAERINQLIFSQRIPLLISFAVNTLLSGGEHPAKIKAYMDEHGYSRMLSNAKVPNDRVYTKFSRLWQASPTVCLFLYWMRKAGGRVLRKVNLLRT